MSKNEFILWCFVICFCFGCKSITSFSSENQAAKLYLYEDTLAVDIKKDSVIFRNYFVKYENVKGLVKLQPYFNNSNPRFVAQYTSYFDNKDYGIMRLSVSACDYFDRETSTFCVIINNDTIEPFNGGFPFSSLPEIKEGRIALYDSLIGYEERSDSLKYTMGSFMYIDKFKHEYFVCPHTLLPDSIQVLQMDPYPILLIGKRKYELTHLEKMSKRKFIKTYFIHVQRENQKKLKQVNKFHHLIED